MSECRRAWITGSWVFGACFHAYRLAPAHLRGEALPHSGRPGQPARLLALRLPYVPLSPVGNGPVRLPRGARGHAGVSGFLSAALRSRSNRSKAFCLPHGQPRPTRSLGLLQKFMERPLLPSPFA